MDKGEYNSDDAQLAQLGHKSELKRNFSMMYVLQLNTNSWIVLTSVFVLEVPCWVLLLPF